MHPSNRRAFSPVPGQTGSPFSRPVKGSRGIAAKLSCPTLVLILLCGACIPVSPLVRPALASDQLTPKELEDIRAKIEELTKTLEEIDYQKNTSLTEVFLQASASGKSAVDFYLDCVQTIDFDRLSRSYTDFRDWREKNEQRLEDEGFLKALQIQLRYLAISTQAARTEKLETVFPLLTAHIDSIASMESIPHPALRTSIESTVFAQRYELRHALQKKEQQWELRPLNIGGMYEKTIFPFLRRHDPASLNSAWQKRIAQEQKMAAINGIAAEINFQRIVLPGLQWAMMKDHYLIEGNAATVQRMLAHIEEHKTTHPKTGEWMTEVITLIFPNGLPASRPAAAPGAVTGEK